MLRRAVWLHAIIFEMKRLDAVLKFFFGGVLGIVAALIAAFLSVLCTFDIREGTQPQLYVVFFVNALVLVPAFLLLKRAKNGNWLAVGLVIVFLCFWRFSIFPYALFRPTFNPD